jgi:uncharacterized protein (DUF1800 family)
MAQLGEAAAVRRLVDRMGFSLGGERLRSLQQQGYAAAARQVLRPAGSDRGAAATPPPDLPLSQRPRRNEQQSDEPTASEDQAGRAERKAHRRSVKQQEQQLRLWWLDRMVAAEHPVRERLTWFWHGHFATSAQKVRRPDAMLAQNETFRRLGSGQFGDLAQAMIVDPAMLIWLDGNDNTAESPNENLSREFLELFTLGHGNYTESDVAQGARSLTGWRVNRRTGEVVLRQAQHDTADKTVLGRTGDLDAADFVAAVLSSPQCARFVVHRLWFRLVSETPPTAATTQRLVEASHRGGIGAVLDAITAEPDFRNTASSLVKQPVEWLVGLMRALDVRPTTAPERLQRRLLAGLVELGQQPFRPPSVGGWPAGAGWLTTSAARARTATAQAIVGSAALSDVPKASPAARAEQVRRLLGVDRFTTRTRSAIDQVSDQLPAALVVAACSPEYVVSA